GRRQVPVRVIFGRKFAFPGADRNGLRVRRCSDGGAGPERLQLQFWSDRAVTQGRGWPCRGSRKRSHSRHLRSARGCRRHGSGGGGMRDRRDKEVIGGCVSTGDASIITSDGEFSASGAGGVTTIYLPKNFRILGISGC